jgi:hypothetical protein
MSILTPKIVRTAAFIALFVILSSASLSAASYGPVGFPKTLLTLYQESDVIAVAKFAKSEHGRAVREDSDFAILETKRYFDVSYVLKGQHSKFLVVADEEFISKEAPFSAAPEQITDDEYHILAGDTVLLFLRKSEDGKKLELVNADDSLKKLKATDLAVYEARIAELRSMYDAGDPEPSKVLTWLIACVREPATRWEGSFELVTSLERAEYQAKQAANDDKQMPAAAEPKFDKAVFAKLISEQQKLELADILLAPASGNESSTRGDNELMELVAKWGDSRLAGYLVGQIRNNPKPSYALTFKIRTLLRLLDDKKAEQLAAKIDDNVAVNEIEEQGKVKHEAILKFVNYAQSRIAENLQYK